MQEDNPMDVSKYKVFVFNSEEKPHQIVVPPRDQIVEHLYNHWDDIQVNYQFTVTCGLGTFGYVIDSWTDKEVYLKVDFSMYAEEKRNPDAVREEVEENT